MCWKEENDGAKSQKRKESWNTVELHIKLNRNKALSSDSKGGNMQVDVEGINALTCVTKYM